MINLQKISKRYVLGDDEVYALRDVSLTIKEKEFVGILGSSGSGKSTLMHIIGLLDLPTEGKVQLFDRNVLELSDDELSKLRNENVGFVFQQFNLINKFTVFENIPHWLKLRTKQRINAKKVAMRSVEAVGFDPVVYGGENRLGFHVNILQITQDDHLL